MQCYRTGRPRAGSSLQGAIAGSLGYCAHVGETSLWPALVQGEQAPLRQASVAEAPVVVSAATFGLECANAHADPTVEPIEHADDFGGTEVPRETSNDRVEVEEDRVDVSPLLTLGQDSDLVLEVFDGLGADPHAEPSKAEAEELEALAEIRETSLCLMEREFESPQHLLDEGPGLDRLLGSGTEHDEVVCVPHVAVAPGLEGLVEVVEDQVREPR